MQYMACATSVVWGISHKPVYNVIHTKLQPREFQVDFCTGAMDSSLNEMTPKYHAQA